MYLYPGSAYLNGARESESVPARYRHLLVPGCGSHFLQSASVQILRQHLAFPEAEWFVYHIEAKGGAQLFCQSTQSRWLFLLVPAGEGVLTTAAGQDIPLRERCHIFLSQPAVKEMRLTVTRGKTVLLCFALSPTGVRMVQRDYPGLLHRNGEKGQPVVASSGYIERYYCEQLLRLPVPEALRTAYLSEQLRVLLRHFCARLLAPVTSPGVSVPHFEKAAAVKDLMDRYPDTNWTLSQLAQQTQWNIQSLKTVFRQVYGTTPHHYLLDARMRLGLELVRSTRDSIVSIALFCGFKRSHHFISLFKQYHGRTPGEARGDRLKDGHSSFE